MRERAAFVARKQFATRGDKSVRAQSIRGRMALQGLYLPADAPWARRLPRRTPELPRRPPRRPGRRDRAHRATAGQHGAAGEGEAKSADDVGSMGQGGAAGDETGRWCEGQPKQTPSWSASDPKRTCFWPGEVDEAKSKALIRCKLSCANESIVFVESGTSKDWRVDVDHLGEK